MGKEWYLVNQVDNYASEMVSTGSSKLKGYNLGKDGYLVYQVNDYASGMVSPGSFELKR